MLTRGVEACIISHAAKLLVRNKWSLYSSCVFFKCVKLIGESKEHCMLLDKNKNVFHFLDVHVEFMYLICTSCYKFMFKKKLL